MKALKRNEREAVPPGMDRCPTRWTDEESRQSVDTAFAFARIVFRGFDMLQYIVIKISRSQSELASLRWLERWIRQYRVTAHK